MSKNKVIRIRLTEDHYQFLISNFDNLSEGLRFTIKAFKIGLL